MRKILIQLDTDAAPSVFDRVVAIDAGVDELFSYGGVTPEAVTHLAHGAIFTRGPADLKNTAIFIGGSDAEAGAAVLKKVRKVFFGPMRVSVMLDSNGCNTTAAAAVRAAGQHMTLKGSRAVVLGATGPVGSRAAAILASQGAKVRLVSRSAERAEQACAAIREKHADATVEAAALGAAADTLREAGILIAAGAAGAQFYSASDWQRVSTLKVAIDLNAVPPVGLEGIDPLQKAHENGGVVCYGAIGVGGSKMKLHKAALKSLFDANDHVLDTAEIYAIATT